MAEAANDPKEMVPVLEPVGRHEGEKKVRLSKDVVLLGTAPAGVHVHLDSSAVSRFHAVVVRNRREVYIRDLASRNGTYVNKQRLVGEKTLHGSDLVHFGDYGFRFRRRGSRALPEPERTRPGMLSEEGGLRYDLLRRTFLIGSREGCDLVMDGEGVGGVHAMIFVHEGKHVVRDFGLGAGTRVNGQGVHQQELSDGDEIEIGGRVFRYAITGAGAAKERGGRTDDLKQFAREARRPVPVEESVEEPMDASVEASVEASGGPIALETGEDAGVDALPVEVEALGAAAPATGEGDEDLNAAMAEALREGEGEEVASGGEGGGGKMEVGGGEVEEIAPSAEAGGVADGGGEEASAVIALAGEGGEEGRAEAGGVGETGDEAGGDAEIGATIAEPVDLAPVPEAAPVSEAAPGGEAGGVEATREQERAEAGPIELDLESESGGVGEEGEAGVQAAVEGEQGTRAEVDSVGERAGTVGEPAEAVPSPSPQGSAEGSAKGVSEEGAIGDAGGAGATAAPATGDLVGDVLADGVDEPELEVSGGEAVGVGAEGLSGEGPMGADEAGGGEGALPRPVEDVVLDAVAEEKARGAAAVEVPIGRDEELKNAAGTRDEAEVLADALVSEDAAQDAGAAMPVVAEEGSEEGGEGSVAGEQAGRVDNGGAGIGEERADAGEMIPVAEAGRAEETVGEPAPKMPEAASGEDGGRAGVATINMESPGDVETTLAGGGEGTGGGDEGAGADWVEGEVGGEKSEVSGQESEVGGERSEVGGEGEAGGGVAGKVGEEGGAVEEAGVGADWGEEAAGNGAEGLEEEIGEEVMEEPGLVVGPGGTVGVKMDLGVDTAIADVGDDAVEVGGEAGGDLEVGGDLADLARGDSTGSAQAGSTGGLQAELLAMDGAGAEVVGEPVGEKAPAAEDVGAATVNVELPEAAEAEEMVEMDGGEVRAEESATPAEAAMSAPVAEETGAEGTEFGRVEAFLPAMESGAGEESRAADGAEVDEAAVEAAVESALGLTAGEATEASANREGGEGMVKEGVAEAGTAEAGTGGGGSVGEWRGIGGTIVEPVEPAEAGPAAGGPAAAHEASGEAGAAVAGEGDAASAAGGASGGGAEAAASAVEAPGTSAVAEGSAGSGPLGVTFTMVGGQEVGAVVPFVGEEPAEEAAGGAGRVGTVTISGEVAAGVGLVGTSLAGVGALPAGGEDFGSLMDYLGEPPKGVSIRAKAAPVGGTVRALTPAELERAAKETLGDEGAKALLHPGRGGGGAKAAARKPMAPELATPQELGVEFVPLQEEGLKVMGLGGKPAASAGVGATPSPKAGGPGGAKGPAVVPAYSGPGPATRGKVTVGVGGVTAMPVRVADVFSDAPWKPALEPEPFSQVVDLAAASHALGGGAVAGTESVKETPAEHGGGQEKPEERKKKKARWKFW